jgi:hypothetical protein
MNDAHEWKPRGCVAAGRARGKYKKRCYAAGDKKGVRVRGRGRELQRRR